MIDIKKLLYESKKDSKDGLLYEINSKPSKSKK